ncbi:aminoglycoside phosphotransferase family protein [Phreatobacter sp. AB_2022a]|uniref:aminoglycoside phosphotransferase family protein n=1 Tax=Phreatobacter sp. AB_2022a TaxID=3003134 RepID=UPI002286FAD7|nr:aminoglycoside phosphotransferase family protein [Phreatobacter sp. AB_2022a]MCZ0734814.1 phosphotransferase [Phreatobacter sp. AB_2022a]
MTEAAPAPPAFPAEWRIVAAELMADTVSSHVWLVHRADGGRAVVKDGKPIPDLADVLRGARYLAWREGDGAARLLAEHGRMMLIEHAGDHMLAEEIATAGDAAATRIAADLLARLLAPAPVPDAADFQPLRRRFAGLFAKADADRKAGRPGLYGEAAALAERLTAAPARSVPLHGDVHHENILKGPRGWLIIDPVGLIGDPAYDAANLFSNPLDRDDLCLSPERIAGMAAILGEALGIAPRRLLDHAFVHACLSAAWHAEDGSDEDEARELAVALAVRSVRDAGD